MNFDFLHRHRVVRRLLKFLLAALSILLLSLGLAFLFFHFNKDQIKRGLLRYVQEHQEGVLYVREIHFSPLTHLPHLAIGLNQVVYYEHPLEKRPAGEAPILDIDRAYLAFNLLPLLTGKYEVREISLRNGEVNLRFYPDNSFNLLNALGVASRVRGELMTYKNKDAPPKVDLILEKINMKNLKGHFVHEGSALAGEIGIQDLKAAMQYRNGMDDIRLRADLNFRHLLVAEKAYFRKKDIQLDLDLILDEHTMVSRIRRSRLIFEGLAFDMAGTYDLSDSGWADLSLDASDQDLTLLSYLVEDDILGQDLDILNRGNLYLRGKVTGKTINHLPEIVFRFGADNISLNIPGQDESIENLGFSGFFNTGEADNFSKSIFRIDHLRGNLPGGQISGALEVTNFADPILTASCQLHADLKGWDRVLKLGGLDSLSGFISLALDVKDWRLAGGDTPDKIKDARLEVQDVSFHLSAFPHRFENVNGVLSGEGDLIRLEGGHFRYGSSRISINGRLNNVGASLAGLDAALKARLQLRADKAKLGEWPFFDTLSERITGEQATGLWLDVSLENRGERRDLFPWTSAGRAVIHQFQCNFERLPDIEAFRAVAKLGRTAGGALAIRAERLDARLPFGEAALRDASFQFGKGTIMADTYLKIRGLHTSQLAGLFTKDSTAVPIIGLDGQLDAAFQLNGNYDWNSRRIDTLSITGGKVKFHLPGSKGISLEDIDLQIQDASFPRGRRNASEQPALAADLSIGRFRTEQIQDMRIQCAVTGRADYYFFQGSLYQWSDVFEEGSIEVDLSGKTPAIHLVYTLKNFPIESALGNVRRAPLMTGPVDISIDLITKGMEEHAWMDNASGSLVVKGEELTLHGVDLKRRLANLQAAQPAKLVDLGAYFLAPPIGTFVTKGRDLDRVFDLKARKRKKTKVSRLISAWAFQNGRLESRDVALTTAAGRIAVDACIDMAADSIDHFTVAVVDPQGCSLLDQTLAGAFSHPKISAITSQKTAGPNCNLFYEGSLAHPKPEKKAD